MLPSEDKLKKSYLDRDMLRVDGTELRALAGWLLLTAQVAAYALSHHVSYSGRYIP